MAQHDEKSERGTGFQPVADASRRNGARHRMEACVMFLALAGSVFSVYAEIGNGRAVSPAFVLDTRDSAGSSLAVSGTFSLDTRGVTGQSGFGASATFPLDTRGGLPVGIGFAQTGTGFGSRTVGSVTDKTFTLTNNGKTTIFGTLSVSSPFSIIGDATYNLAPGQSKTFTIRFAPSSAGTFTGYVTLSGGGGYTAQITASAIADPSSALGAVSGRVIDAKTLQPIDGVRVGTRSGGLDTTAVSPATGQKGIYLISGLAPGAYTLTFDAPGQTYYYKELKQVTVAASGTVVVGNTALDPLPGFDDTARLPQNLPVVLVRGRGEVTTPDQTWSALGSRLRTGSPAFANVWDPNQDGTTLDGTQSIDWNAERLRTYIGKRVEAYRNADSNTKKSLPPGINFVAHSMGGLIVRCLLDNHTYITCPVDGENQRIPVNLTVMLGTPNSGSVLEDAGQAMMWGRWIPGIGALWTGLVFFSNPDWPSSMNLSTNYVLHQFNASYAWPSTIPCFRLAATGGAESGNHELRLGDSIIRRYVGGIAREMVNDGAVTRPSVSGRYYTSATEYEQSPAWTVDSLHDKTDVEAVGHAVDHFSLTEDAAIQTWVFKILKTGAIPSGIVSANSLSSGALSLSGVSLSGGGAAAVNALSGETDSDTVAVPVIFDERSGVLAQEGTASICAPSDAASSLTVTLVAGDSGVGFTLCDPSGTPVVSGSGGVTLSWDADPATGTLFAVYTVPNPAPGFWTARLDGTAISSGTNTGYNVTFSGDSTVALLPATGPFFHYGRDALLACTLRDEAASPASPITTASVTAEVTAPDGTSSAQTLADDGLSGDGAPEDGRYAGVVSGLGNAGQYGVAYRVTGTNASGNPYARYATGVFTVSTDRAVISGSITTKGVAAGNGNESSSMQVNCWVTAAASGTYRLTGVLVDTSGTISVPASVNMEDIAPGTTTATLNFDLAPFAAAGFTGNATLSNVQLFEQTESGLEWQDAFSDSVAVTIGPRVTASPQDQAVEEGTALSLPVVAEGGTLRYQWYFNGVAIAGATNSIFAFDRMTAAQSGTYSVSVSNETGVLQGPAFSITARPATTFENWRHARFDAGQLADTNVSGLTADPAGNGVSNLLRYAFGGEPFHAGQSILPVSTLEPDSADGQIHPSFSFRQRINTTDLTYVLEVSDNLTTWDSSGSQIEPVDTPSANSDGVTQQVKVRVRTPLEGLRKKFIRLRIIQTE